MSMAWIRGNAEAQRMNWGSCWFWLMLVALLFSACGKTNSVQKPVEVQDLQVRSQERIFHAAKSDVLSGRYAEAIEKLNRFLSTYPGSDFEPEVRWLLARSYHKSGKVKAALKSYQRLLDQAEVDAHHDEAKRYMEQIQASLIPSTPPSTPSATRPSSSPRIRHTTEVFALQMTLGQWLEGRDWKTRLKNMSRRGVTTQLINLECGMMKEDVGALFQVSSGMNSSPKGMSERFSSFVAHAHQHGLTVFLGVNVRCLGQLDRASGIRWADRAYDQKTKKLRSTKYFDLFNREYQKFLKNILARLANSGIDGIVFLGDAPMGMFDGVTPIALKKFQQEFGVTFYPKKVFAIKSFKGKSERRVGPPKDSEFWRWIGWRARAQLKVLQDLMQGIRRSHSQFQVALELYAGGLNDPLRTLLQLNEDILESHNLNFSFLVVDVDGPQHFGGSSGGLQGRFQQESLPNIARRFLEVFKDPTKLWLTVPRKLGIKAWSSESLKELTGQADVPQGVGLVYDLRPFS